MMSTILFRRHPAASIACTLAASLTMILSGCKDKPQGDGAPPPAHVIQVPDMNLITIDSNDAGKFHACCRREDRVGRAN